MFVVVLFCCRKFNRLSTKRLVVLISCWLIFQQSAGYEIILVLFKETSSVMLALAVLILLKLIAFLTTKRYLLDIYLAPFRKGQLQWVKFRL